MEDKTVANIEEISEKDRLITDIDGEEVGVFNIDGEIFIYKNQCPNQGGPVLEGRIGGSMVTEYDKETDTVETSWQKEDQIIACPWCSWEFDLKTGLCESTDSASLIRVDFIIENGEIQLKA